MQAELRTLFTADKGFGDIRAYPPGSHSGVVVFRLPRESRAGYMKLVESFLRSYSVDDVAGGVLVVSPRAIRVHRGGERA